MQLKIGDKAPDFTTWSTSAGDKVGDLFTLSERLAMRKAVVLAFFPLAFTPGCSAELTQFRMDVEEFRQLNAEVVGCSTDSVFALNEFSKQTNCPWVLVSDWNRAIAPLYDSLQTLPNGMSGVCRRSVFVIDQHGFIRYTWSSDGRSLPNDEEILGAIRSL